jgi:hypothetical protein
MVYDPSSPDPDHAGLSDIDQIKENLNKLRCFEAGSAEPSNPVTGMFWLDTYASTYVMKVRNKANDGWISLFELADTGVPKDHIADNITSSNMVHGVQQGSGNLFDADKLDGLEATAFMQASNVPMGHYSYDGSDIMIDSNDTVRTAASAVWAKVKEFTLHKTPGTTVRFYAEHKCEPGSAETAVRIYKNGVYVSGTERAYHPCGSYYRTETWDITGVSDGDTIEIWTRSYQGNINNVQYIRNFRLVGKPYVEKTYDQDVP